MSKPAACIISTRARLHAACHWRKLDKFLIPAVRRATRLADDLLVELDRLSAQSSDALAVMGAFDGAIDGALDGDTGSGTGAIGRAGSGNAVTARGSARELR